MTKRKFLICRVESLSKITKFNFVFIFWTFWTVEEVEEVEEEVEANVLVLRDRFDLEGSIIVRVGAFLLLL